MRGGSEEGLNIGIICKSRLLRLKRLLELQTEQYKREIDLESSAVEFMEVVLSRLQKATARLGYIRSQRSKSVRSISKRSKMSLLRKETEEDDSQEVPAARSRKRTLRLGLTGDQEQSFIGPVSSKDIRLRGQHKRISSVRYESDRRPLVRTFSPGLGSLSSNTNELNEPNSRKRHSIRTKVFESHVNSFDARPILQGSRDELPDPIRTLGLSDAVVRSRRANDSKRSHLPRIELTTKDFKETSGGGSKVVASMIEMGFLKKNPLPGSKTVTRQHNRLNTTLNLKGSRGKQKEQKEFAYIDNF